ncbi:MAG: PfkB family carbohydrate kinase [Omnitrophica WOR_2 bacterium]
MNKNWDILGIGISAVDDLLYVDHFPQPDSKMPIRSAQRQGGGLTATALVAASRQGARTAYCSLVSDNELSQYTIQELEKEGVDCSPCIQSPDGRPAHSFVIVDQGAGTRTIMFIPGIVDPEPEDITAELIQRCRVLFIDYLAPRAGLAAAKLAHRYGIPVVADIEPLPFPAIQEFIQEIDHLIVGITLAGRLTGKTHPEDMVRALANPGKACCVVTAGKEGCWYSQQGDPVIHFPAFNIQVVDSTGCGDVFHGAYAAALARGEDIQRAIEVASASAAIKATQPGGRSGIPDLRTVECFIQERRKA